MYKLLYIPGGKFCKFRVEDQSLTEDLMQYCNSDREENKLSGGNFNLLINYIITNRDGWDNFYCRNNISPVCTSEEFEVIEE